MNLTDSVFVRHESCPSCNSRDNLGVWSDGHKFCFGCGHFVPPTSRNVEYIRKILNKETPQKKKIELPHDCSLSIPAHASAWLALYNVYHSDAIKHHIMWSESRKALIFPIKEKNEIIFYQERKFEGKPKYLTHGALDNHIPLLPAPQTKNNLGTVIVVEDFISAVRVSRRYDCVPLFGSHLNKKLATRLAQLYSNLGIWLDNDKASQSIQFQNQYAALFDSAFSIFSNLDPKCYSDNDISDFVMDAEVSIYDA